MEVKKNAKADVNRYRPMFLNIGFAITLVLVTTAFEWKTVVSKPIVLNNSFDQEDILMIPPTVITPPPPPPPVIQAPIIHSIDDAKEEPLKDIVIEFPDPLDDFPEPVIYEEEPEAVEEAEDFVDYADEMPEPKGGLDGFYKKIGKNIKYPRMAQRAGVGGKVFARFIVNEEGEMSDIQIIKGIGYGCDEEALRVLKKGWKWNPGRQKGKRVRVRMVLPISFTLK